MAKPIYTLRRKVHALIVGLIGWTALIAAFSISPPADIPQWIHMLVLAVFSVLVSAIGANLPNTRTYISLEGMAYYSAALSLNPAAAGLVAMLPIVRWRLTEPVAIN